MLKQIVNSLLSGIIIALAIICLFNLVLWVLIVSISAIILFLPLILVLLIMIEIENRWDTIF